MISPEAGKHVVADQSEVLRFLAEPASYGRDVQTVERIDTHGAVVFLAGARVYKIKRAVSYPYMNFSTLERRRSSCEREVALNRRTAPDLYLGAVAIVRQSSGQLAFGEEGEAVEWAVEMRRFAQDDLLDRKAQDGSLTADMILGVADAVADLHESTERIDHDHAMHAAASMKWVIDENAEEFAERPDLFDRAAVDGLSKTATAAHAQIQALLDARGRDGFVRRCHGDLHLRNIFLSETGATLFDAIEFNDALACIDVFYDLAFLLMDLDQRNLRPFANLVLNRYLQRTDDVEGLGALPLFQSARAAVRAKTSASAEARQENDAARVALRARAQAYLDAAQRYLEPAAPCLWAIGGLSGTGKTSVARRISPDLGAAPGALHLRSDVIRKARFSVDERAPLPEDAYTPDVNARVYGEMARSAERALAAGHSVVVDAVFAQPGERDAMAAMAERLGVDFRGFWLTAPSRELIERVEARRGDASDAGAAVVRKQRTYDLGPIAWREIDARGPVEAVVARCVKAARD